MRRLGVLWLLFLAGMPAASPAQSPDRALSLPGTWACESVAHTTSSMTFTRQPDGSMSMLNAYATADGVHGQFDETYRFDSASGDWIWSSGDSETGSTEAGTAPRWTGTTWTFDGTRQLPAKRSESIRMVYTRQSNNAFRRDFLSDRNGTWATTSSSVCHKT